MPIPTIITKPSPEMPRASLSSDRNQPAKLCLVEKDTGKILGVHLLGTNADEIINVFATAMKANVTVDSLKEIIFSYPTSSSDIKYMLPQKIL